MTLDDLARAARLRDPRWHLYRGVTGLLYGRLRMTSPPRTVRAATVEGLREQIEAEMAYRDEYWG